MPHFKRNHLVSLLSLLAVGLAPIAACSSDGGSEPTTGTDGGASSDSSTSSCSCSVTVNGDAKKITCGEDGCVGGKPYHCGAGASLSQGGSGCTAPADGGSDTSAPAATTVPCKQFPPKPQTCDAKTEYCIISTPSGGEVCAPLPTGCHACPCASSDTEAAWKKLENGTINCTNVVITCNDVSGAITATCKR